MTTIEQNEKVALLIEELSKDPDVIKIVKDIEGKIMTTQDHYGDYMEFLSQYSKSMTELYIISKAMIKAGANANGVSWAVKLLKGSY
jgi:hypothetical protein